MIDEDKLEALIRKYSVTSEQFNKLVENVTKLAGIVSDQHSGNMLLNEKMNGIIERIENLEKEQN